MGQDYNVLLSTVVTGTSGAAAGCLCRERLGERKNTFILVTFQKTYEEKFPKMAKMTNSTVKSPKIYRKIT
jgi:hypothetical protein